jgi:hypothetical protein
MRTRISISLLALTVPLVGQAQNSAFEIGQATLNASPVARIDAQTHAPTRNNIDLLTATLAQRQFLAMVGINQPSQPQPPGTGLARLAGKATVQDTGASHIGTLDSTVKVGGQLSATRTATGEATALYSVEPAQTYALPFFPNPLPVLSVKGRFKGRARHTLNTTPANNSFILNPTFTLVELNGVKLAKVDPVNAENEEEKFSDEVTLPAQVKLTHKWNFSVPTIGEAGGGLSARADFYPTQIIVQWNLQIWHWNVTIPVPVPLPLPDPQPEPQPEPQPGPQPGPGIGPM